MDWIWEMYRTHVPDSSPFGAETSPLHHAAGCASKEALEWLLKKGVDVNAEDVVEFRKFRDRCVKSDVAISCSTARPLCIGLRVRVARQR